MFIENIKKFTNNNVFKVTLVVFFIFFIFHGDVNSATLDINTDVTTLSVGDISKLNIVVDTKGVAINNVETIISFPADIIEVISVSKNNSKFTLWVDDPTFSNTSGIIAFNAGIPTPGYNGNQGQVISIVVKAKKVGIAEFEFSNSAIRANDGFGTNILNIQEVTKFSITVSDNKVEPAVYHTEVNTNDVPLVIQSLTHPVQNEWYANPEPEFLWELPDDALEVRTVLGKNPQAKPSISYIPPISKKKIDELPNGTYYFALQFRNINGWSPISRYRVNIDTLPPKPFSITFPRGPIGYEPQPVVLFNTKDTESGISHYEIKVGSDGKPFRNAPQADTNPYVLPAQMPGNYIVTVTAVDNAGNIRTSSGEYTIEGIDPPVITYYPKVIENSDILKIIGTTYPDSEVYLYVKEGDRLISEEYTRSNSLGDFVVVVTKSLDPSIYTFTTRVKDGRGAQSIETLPITVSVESEFLSDILDFVLKYYSVVIIVIFVLGSVAWLIIMIIRTIRYTHHKSYKSENESEHLLSVLCESIQNHVTQLKKVKRKLTDEEIEFLEQFDKKFKKVMRK